MTFTTYAERFSTLLQTLDKTEVEGLVEALYDTYAAGSTVFIIGNGGSGANASHLCEDLGKGTVSDPQAAKRLKVISLTDNVPYILAWANDHSFECIFTEQLRNLAGPGDLLIAISASGNSPNILHAVEYANGAGLRTFGVTGLDGGRLLGLARESLYVKSNDMGMVEAAHSVVFHYLTDRLKARFAAP